MFNADSTLYNGKKLVQHKVHNDAREGNI